MTLSNRPLAALALLASLVTVPAHAADIRRDTLDGNPIIFVTGQIEYGDELRFEAAALGLAKAAVILDGPGGNLHAGIEIGTSIRRKGFVTAVARQCASACAFAWLGGTARLVAAGARVGFHAAWIANAGRNEATAGGNALLGAYLNQLGMSPVAIVHLTAAGPDEVTWLTAGDARDVGIDVKWTGRPVVRVSVPAPVYEGPGSLRDD